ncbi:uncharacterized protein [Spinacia oleracea]|uniref:Uncharacterized protein n=1 Tax=Spinacia oleracea TaxID=3562 RepID=A0ABM3R4S8_SPIOL|nr:uncharacterized protein LOC130465791 [Spinacia oleracea]
MFLTFNEFGQPDGEWAHAYGVQIGICVLKIDINEPSYPKMEGVTKQNFWEETKRLFHIIDLDGQREKSFHKVVAARFRIFKSRLVGRWIKFTIKPPKNSAHLMPWQVYKGFITEEQWEKFKSSRLQPDAEEKRLKAQGSAKQNKHPHHMGQLSYPRAVKKWEKDKRLPPSTASSTASTTSSSGTSSISSRVTNRPIHWVLAHQKKMPDGTWDVDPN